MNFKPTMKRTVLQLTVFLCCFARIFCQASESDQENATEPPVLDPLERCKLSQENVSLASLDKTDYFVAKMGNERIYIAICHRLQNLPKPASDLCDPLAYSCTTKVNNETGLETELIRNAGSQTVGPIRDGKHVAMEFKGGQDCKDSFNNTTPYRTRVDFFCNFDYAMDNSVRYEAVLGKCTSQVFWYSSLACFPEDIEAKEIGSCVLKIPGYDTTLDLSAWAKPEGEYYLARSVKRDAGDKERLFQMNLCKPVTGGDCTDDSAVCEVDDTEENLVQNLLDKNPKRILTYNELKEIITLKYIDDKSHQVVIDIKCEHTALEPEISLQYQKGTLYRFLFLTQHACFVPAAQCTAEGANGDIFSLAQLNRQEFDVGVPDTNIRYAIKVCGSLPLSSEIPCTSQTGVCTYKEDSESGRIDAVSLGVMYEKPQVNEDQSISITYKNGDSFTDPATNETCYRSATINLYCSEKEKLPQWETATDCEHQLVWETPVACPMKTAVSHDCTVREPLYSNLFNLSDLHNASNDYRLTSTVPETGKNLTLVINVCGPLVSCSEGDGEVCLEHETDLTYEDGSLVMRHRSDTICPSNNEENITASFIFLCHHDKKAGSSGPTLTPPENSCHLDLTWYTDLACPPHETVQCSVVGPEGVVDLSSLSLPHQNYHVRSDSGTGDFTINVCRSLVHGNGSHCPYKSAACFTKTGLNGQIDANNLGQVSNRLQIDREGKVFITYKLGSICMEPTLNKGHIDTTIHFYCEEGAFDTEPEFVESSKCSYTFQWRHAAACPVKQEMEGNCTVTNPASGFTFNLSSLQLKNTSQYRWKGTYHHHKGAYQFNVCGQLAGTKCPVGSGVCTLDGKDMGKANANLMIEDGHLSLNYSDGSQCEENGAISKMSTLIKFVCPPRREIASGNHEKDGPRLVRRDSKCVSAVEFYTDLACDNQVHCEVNTDNGVTYSLTRLRKHQHNYHVQNKNEGENDFVLNICGPLVPADVPSSKCSPHSACSSVKSSDNQNVGMGKSLSSPYMGDNGHLVIDYLNGALCGNRGDRWSTRIIFTCERSEKNAEHPLGVPEHVSTAECRNTFHFPTILACNDTMAVKSFSEPDSCQIYHPGYFTYFDISSLVANTTYKVQDEMMKKNDEYFEIQPCGKAVKSCGGAICKVTQYHNYSLGLLNDFQYEPNLDSVRLRYLEGSECNTNTGAKWRAKIYYTCDPNKGIGAPVIQNTYDCLVIFDWRTSALCKKGGESPTLPPIDDITPQTNDVPEEQIAEEVPPVTGGASWGQLFLVLCFIFLIGAAVVLYRKPAARERVFRVFQEARARMPVVLGGRGRDDSTLLVSNGNMSAFGSLTDDEDFS